LDELSVATVCVVPDIVIVLVPFVKMDPAPEESQLPLTLADPLEKERVVPPPTVTLPTVIVDVDAVSPPVPASDTLPPPVMAKPDVVRTPAPDVASVPDTSMAVLCVIVPEIVRFANPLADPAILTVVPAPVRVTVLEPFVNVVTLVSQLPEMLKLAVPDIVKLLDAKFASAFSPAAPVYEPDIVRALNPWVPLIATVLLAPARVIELVPFVNVEPAPLVFQLPLTVHDPEVRVIVPDTPPVIVTSPTVTVAWLPLTTPALFTVKVPVPKVKKPAFPATSVRVPLTLTPLLPVLIVPVVMLNVVPLPTVTAPTVREDVVPVIPPVPARETVPPPVTALPDVVSVPEPEVDNVPLTSIAFDWVTVPETAKL
jgi:hypothetical protein